MAPVSPAEIARAMDCPVELLGDLPELLEGLDSLGCDPQRLIGVLNDAGVPADLSGLDLGCGKGAFGVALAKRGHLVTGVDAFGPFVESARGLAERESVADRCRFEERDLRDAAGDGAFGLACLISVGRPFGTLGRTVEALRAMAAPDGWILIEDSYRAAPEPVPGFEEYAQFDETLAEVSSCAVEVVRVERSEPADHDAHEDRMQQLMRERAREFVARSAPKAGLVRRFLETEQRIAQIYERDLPGVIFLLRRTG